MIKSKFYLRRNDGFAYYILGKPSVDIDGVYALVFEMKQQKGFEDCIRYTSIDELRNSAFFTFLSDDEMKSMKVVEQDSKLKVGSRGKYNNKYYDVCALQLYTYAQSNIKSAVLLDPLEINASIKNGIYKGLDDSNNATQLSKQLEDGKFDNSFIFIFIDANNFSEKFSGVQQPPVFIASDFQDVEIKKVINEGVNFGFYSLYQNVRINENTLEFDSSNDLTEIENVGSVPYTVLPEDNLTNGFGSLEVDGVAIRKMVAMVQPLYYRATNSFTINIDYTLYSEKFYNLTILGLKNSRIFTKFLMSDTTRLPFGDMKTFIENFNDQTSGDMIIKSKQLLNKFIVKENTKIGKKNFSSKNHLKDLIDDKKFNKLKDFGQIYETRKNLYAVGKYFLFEDKIMCFSFKINLTDDELYTTGKTNFKKIYKILEYDKIDRFSKKGKNVIFDFESIYKTNESSVNSIVDLFKRQREGNLDALTKRNPYLAEAILNTLKLVDIKQKSTQPKILDSIECRVKNTGSIFRKRENLEPRTTYKKTYFKELADQSNKFLLQIPSNEYNKEVYKYATECFLRNPADQRDNLAVFSNFDEVYLYVHYMVLLNLTPLTDSNFYKCELDFSISSGDVFYQHIRAEFIKTNYSNKPNLNVTAEKYFDFNLDVFTNQYMYENLWEITKFITNQLFEIPKLYQSIISEACRATRRFIKPNYSFLFEKINTRINKKQIPDLLRIENFELYFFGFYDERVEQRLMIDYIISIIEKTADDKSEFRVEGGSLTLIFRKNPFLGNQSNETMPIEQLFVFYAQLYKIIGDEASAERIKDYKNDKPILINPKPQSIINSEISDEVEDDDDVFDDLDLDSLVGDWDDEGVDDALDEL